MREYLKTIWKQEDVDENTAISFLLYSTWELKQDTRDYLAAEWLKRVRMRRPPRPERDRHELAASIRNLKTLLWGKGISMEKAEEMIAAGLELPSVGALRQRLTRAPRK
jgi:hypothetical protein